MSTTGTSSEKMSEALRLLDEAARERRQELQGLMGDRYGNLRSAMSNGERNLLRVARRTKDQAVERAKRTASGVDKHVRTHPWPYIGGAAASALVVGYIVAKKRKKK